MSTKPCEKCGTKCHIHHSWQGMDVILCHGCLRILDSYDSEFGGKLTDSDIEILLIHRNRDEEKRKEEKRRRYYENFKKKYFLLPHVVDLTSGISSPPRQKQRMIRPPPGPIGMDLDSKNR